MKTESEKLNSVDTYGLYGKAQRQILKKEKDLESKMKEIQLLGISMEDLYQDNTYLERTQINYIRLAITLTFWITAFIIPVMMTQRLLD